MRLQNQVFFTVTVAIFPHPQPICWIGKQHFRPVFVGTLTPWYFRLLLLVELILHHEQAHLVVEWLGVALSSRSGWLFLHHDYTSKLTLTSQLMRAFLLTWKKHHQPSHHQPSHHGIQLCKITPQWQLTSCNSGETRAAWKWCPPQAATISFHRTLS